MARTKSQNLPASQSNWSSIWEVQKYTLNHHHLIWQRSMEKHPKSSRFSRQLPRVGTKRWISPNSPNSIASCLSSFQRLMHWRQWICGQTQVPKIIHFYGAPFLSLIIMWDRCLNTLIDDSFMQNNTFDKEVARVSQNCCAKQNLMKFWCVIHFLQVQLPFSSIELKYAFLSNCITWLLDLKILFVCLSVCLPHCTMLST